MKIAIEIKIYIAARSSVKFHYAHSARLPQSISFSHFSRFK